jgi:hypothetical protein
MLRFGPVDRFGPIIRNDAGHTIEIQIETKYGRHVARLDPNSSFGAGGVLWELAVIEGSERRDYDREALNGAMKRLADPQGATVVIRTSSIELLAGSEGSRLFETNAQH